MELHGSGIQVSLIEPGPISTHFSQNVNQAQSDKPVHNPGIAKRLTLPPEAILPNCATRWKALAPNCATR